MKVLLDTHILIWLINDPAHLSSAEIESVDCAAAVFVSAACLWELRVKWHKFDRHGRRKGVLDPAAALSYCRMQGWEVAPLVGEDSIVALDPPIGHNDPFDHMLLVQTQRLGAKLLTRDRQLRDHPLALQL